ncbi:MAG: type I glyceraldehyde-3-phosphate dehydrogenase [OM182 bacterium MED-G24]|uniref:Glyceraldehyde-3-phosphate dehydrogenase n=1 Tax=OM182 bacterium MED-G24 TaxID=1986255 RepID=A0A2A5X051_9GAMM|nr:MAG: type I glyceraldehyde-3-phosphate dehydrogenase [OM182 bacterium MED-G24]|tara:strand:- start:6057 stop:7064 length:1008 start_codon:yes stop_codon:yes gene_type:complete
MATRIAINGFGRMGRLALRAAWAWPELEIAHINEIAGNAAGAAHLLQFDSIHGTWTTPVDSDTDAVIVDGQRISYSSNEHLEDTPWGDLGIDIAVECTGKFKSSDALSPYLDNNVSKIVVSAPVKDGTLNIVVGVNDNLYQPEVHDIVTAASCTTNCIAPVISVIHEQFGIRHGSITTIHDITNTQSVLDEYHKDLRRARASGMSLIPTSTGSATAIAEIFPELRGKIDGLAVRVPLANASVTDCVFEVEQPTTEAAVNQALKDAATGRLTGILGFEDRPLVSADFRGDKRSSIVDADSTMVIDDTQVKILAWYDNEIGYVNRMMELVRKVAESL